MFTYIQYEYKYAYSALKKFDEYFIMKCNVLLLNIGT